MQKRAIIYDLDNTIYPVHTIGDKLFDPMFKLITENGEHHNIGDIKDDMMRMPFQVVANKHHFNDALTKSGLQLLQELTYDGEIKTFEDYPEIKNLPAKRYLVTTGFLNLQYSKIKGMGIENDFAEIHVVDPTTSARSKKDVFADIIERHGYAIPEVLVVGDDPESEIKAAHALGIDTVLYDKYNRYTSHAANYKIANFKELVVCMSM